MLNGSCIKQYSRPLSENVQTTDDGYSQYSPDLGHLTPRANKNSATLHSISERVVKSQPLKAPLYTNIAQGKDTHCTTRSGTVPVSKTVSIFIVEINESKINR